MAKVRIDAILDALESWWWSQEADRGSRSIRGSFGDCAAAPSTLSASITLSSSWSSSSFSSLNPEEVEAVIVYVDKDKSGEVDAGVRGGRGTHTTTPAGRKKSVHLL